MAQGGQPPPLERSTAKSSHHVLDPSLSRQDRTAGDFRAKETHVRLEPPSTLGQI